MTPPPDPSRLTEAEKDALILVGAQPQTRAARMAALAEPIAELEARWGEPPKTSGNSSLPPSARKANRRT
jgi:hypothetical protein